MASPSYISANTCMDAIKTLVDDRLGGELDGGGLILYAGGIADAVAEQFGGSFKWSKGQAIMCGFSNDSPGVRMGDGSVSIDVQPLDFYVFVERRDAGQQDKARRRLLDLSDRLKWETFYDHTLAIVQTFHETISAMEYESRRSIADVEGIYAHALRFNMRPRRTY